MHAPQHDTLHQELRHLVRDIKNCELALARKLAEMQTSGEFRRYASSMQGEASRLARQRRSGGSWAWSGAL